MFGSSFKFVKLGFQNSYLVVSAATSLGLEPNKTVTYSMPNVALDFPVLNDKHCGEYQGWCDCEQECGTVQGMSLFRSQSKQKQASEKCDTSHYNAFEADCVL